MVQFRNYNFNEKIVTALCFDDYASKYIWIAFAKNNDGKCILHKASAFNPYQNYFELEYEVDRINRIVKQGNYIYLAVEDTTYIGYRISTTSPTTTFTAINIPVGINESPIDIAVDVNYIYILTPGNMTGEVAKITKMTLAGNLEEIIELDESGNTPINDAVGITIDSLGNIWVVTGTDPAQLIRVYEDSGGIYTYTIHELK